MLSIMSLDLKILVNEYIESKRNLWSETTLKSVKAKLITCIHLGINTDLYNQLILQGKGRYTAQIYLTLTSNFEQEMLNTSNIRQFISKNKQLFRNAYKFKETAVKQEQYAVLLKTASVDKKLHNLCYLMGSCGLRLSEALNARWADIKEGSLLNVVGKGDKQRFVPISVNPLQKAEESGEYIVGPKTPFRRFFRHQSINPHSLRAYYATRITQALSPFEAAKVLGHSSINTTMRYVRTDLNEIAKKINKI